MFYNFARYLLKPFFYLLYRVRFEGKENIPLEGPYIVCANHVSAIDPILIGIAFPRRLFYMAKAELFKTAFMNGLLKMLGVFPVKRGEADIKSIKTSIKLLSEKKILALFPEGTRNKTEELRAEPGIAMLAVKSKVSVLPIAITSNYKFFKRSVIRVGAPIDLSSYFNQKLRNEDYLRLSVEIMKSVTALKKDEADENHC